MVSPSVTVLDAYSAQPQALQMNSELREFWRWYTTNHRNGPHSSSFSSRGMYRIFKIVVLWSAFCYVFYRLTPSQYWGFFRGVLANPFVILFLLALYVRSALLNFLGARLGQSVAGAQTNGVLAELSVLGEYRQKYGKSDFFYRCYDSIGWAALGCLMVGGLYWFFSLPK